MMNEPGNDKRVYRVAQWTDEQRETLNAIADRLESERLSDEELVASGKYAGPIPLGVYHAFMQSLHRLKEARESQGLSLSDVEARSGLTRSAISKLENGQNLNPTMTTVLRYAAALGKSVTLTCEDLITA
jgi:DNA-binding XRE family transcriptional regulator